MKSLLKSAGFSAALSVLFLVVYGGCNWITSLRPHVGSFYFAWERRIPFVPAMIVPYMSIDLFFIAAPFLARSDRSLRTLAGRLTLAILVGGACFLLFPLKFAFERPHVDGPLGLIFNNFRNFDLPFNECPCLHIGLLTILADFYLRRFNGLVRWVLIAWFILIALSPLLTYQHHMVDIVGGFALAAVCLHLIDDQPLRQPFMPNRRVGIYYATAAALFALLAVIAPPCSIILLWPAFSLALVAAGYLFLGPGIYRKQNGRHPFTTRLLLWPILLAQRLSLAYYTRRCNAYDPLTGHLWIGRRLSPREAEQAREAGVAAVIDLTAELSEPAAFADLPYLQLAMLDLTAPTPAQMDQALAFLSQHAPAGIVYLHCKAGYSRTAAVAGAYLIATGAASTLDNSIDLLRKARPSIVIRSEAMASLRAFASISPSR